MLDPFNINSNFADSFSFQHDQDIQPDLYVLRQGEIQKQKPHLNFEEHSNSSKKKCYDYGCDDDSRAGDGPPLNRANPTRTNEERCDRLHFTYWHPLPSPLVLPWLLNTKI